uniref:Estradiol 17-beta-dehydrogenase 12-B n=1 Tax=Schistosoma japonicum TaxID=6182 RepID=C1LHA7_SCHJA|nr:Estradiol 17-beta-dehydrogenase 12-B [Schistosoma japonicum]
MLISRNPQKLATVANEIERKFNVETRTVTADFTNIDVYHKIQEAVNQLSSIACLVNNVGMGVPKLDYYATTDYVTLNFIKNIVCCNTLPVASITHLILPKMLKQQTSGFAIINIGSHSAYRPFPFLSLYSATKAFVNQLSRSISHENYGKQIIIQTVCPMFVSTAMNGYAKRSLFVPNAQVYAKSALDMLGVEEETFGYFGHAIKAYLTGFLPNLIWRHYMLFMKSWFDKQKRQ